MAEASPLQDRTRSARARRRTQKPVDGNAVTDFCDMCGTEVAVDPSGLCRLGHRLMTSEAAVERHIEAGSAILDRRISGHIPAPEEYVSYQDLSVEIDLEPALDGTLPPTAPPSFSIALPSAASRRVPVSIGRDQDAEEPTPEPSEPPDSGLDFFASSAGAAVTTDQPTVDNAASVENALPMEDVAPMRNETPEEYDALLPDETRAVEEAPAIHDDVAVMAHSSTVDDTAPLEQDQILDGEAPADQDLPVMDPTPDLPSGEGTLQIPERLRRPLPARDDLAFDASHDGFVDLTGDNGSIDVSSMIDVEDDYDLDIRDNIPDVSGEVSIEQNLAVLDGLDLPVEEPDDALIGEPRVFSRRQDESLDAGSVLLDAAPDQIAADLDPAASSVLDGSRTRPPELDGPADDLPPIASEVTADPDDDPLPSAEVSEAHDISATWSSNALRATTPVQRRGFADSLEPSPDTSEGADWDQMLEPRRSWWDRIAAVIFVLVLAGVAMYLAQSI